VICEEARNLLHGYIDRELDLVNSLAVENHLHECPACAQACRNFQAVSAALQAAPRAYSAPPGLRQRIRASIRGADKASAVRFRLRWKPVALAASLLFVLVVSWALVQILSLTNLQDRIAQDLTANHVRSLMLDGHRTDVVSTDQHTVKPWFNGKVDFSPLVLNPAPSKFPLVGGRLEWLDNRPVAVLVYECRKHLINLYTWPVTASPDAAPAGLSRQGFRLVHWTQAGMNYWAISDLNADDLQTFVHMLREHSAP
jgi:anti-sigma factor RsiW